MPRSYLCTACSDGPRIEGERYCAGCRALKIEELDRAGYLTRVPRSKRIHALLYYEGSEAFDAAARLIEDRPC